MFSTCMHIENGFFSAWLSPPPTSFPSVCLYDKAPTITSFSLSLSDSLQCNYADCPLKHDTQTRTDGEGQLVYNIWGFNCSFLDCSSVTVSDRTRETSLVCRGFLITAHRYTQAYIFTPEGITAFHFHSSPADMLHQWPARPRVASSKCAYAFVYVCACVCACLRPCVCMPQGGTSH